jgi:hypothetical protein
MGPGPPLFFRTNFVILSKLSRILSKLSRNWGEVYPPNVFI